MCRLSTDIGRQLPLEPRRSLYQGQQGDVSLCAETIKPDFEGDNSYIIKLKYTLAVRSNILSKLILQAVCDTSIARNFCGCVDSVRI